MKTPDLSKHYSRLTPMERFCLIHAAAGCNDDLERERLMRSVPKIAYSAPDHTPHAQAFDELATIIFLEVLDTAARYTEALAESNSVANNSEEASGAPEGDPENLPTWQRWLDLTLALGYLFRKKVEGWKLFCERRKLPPFLIWGVYPGYERFQRTLRLSESCAFHPEGMVQWLNRSPADEPSQPGTLQTIEHCADDLDRCFETMIGNHGG